LPIVRAANTGVSAVIDPYGRIVKSLGLDETGYLDAELPEEVAPTIYSYTGDAIFLLLVVGLTSVGLFFLRSTEIAS
jgi:apolipoprotein N-acyltransferase